MENFKFENQYGDYLSIEGVLEHFIDDICGRLDSSLEDDKTLESNLINNYQKQILFMGNGMKLEIEICFDEKENEWICTCKEIR